MEEEGELMPMPQNDPAGILAEFKKAIHQVPVNWRGKALAQYNVLKSYMAKDTTTEAEIDINAKAIEKITWDVTSSMDDIIEGNRKVTDEELASVTEFLKDGETLTEDANDGKVMADYWLTVFKNGSMVMKDQDEPILKSLKRIDIRVEEHAKEPKQTKVATLKCIFDENEYFENTELSVVIEYEWLSIPKKSTGTVIKWKPGKIVTTRPIEKKKGKNQRKKDKKGGKTETVAQKLSFFDIFRDFKVEKSTAVEDPMNPQPSLELVDEMVTGITDIAGEDSLYYYLDCVHLDEFEDLEAIDEENEDSEEEAPKPLKGGSRKASHKSGKSGKSGKDGKEGKKSKKASRKNTADEVPIPAEPNKEECKQN